MAIPHDDYVKVTDWLASGVPAILVEIASVKGSAPRDGDAAMAVSEHAMAGTIGGGQLEWIALGEARQRLRLGEPGSDLDIPLGPEIGQCCGGRVVLRFSIIDATIAERLRAQAERQRAGEPHVLIFGAGHTGRALARAFESLPCRAFLVDTRAECFAGYRSRVEALHVAMPEAAVRDAPPASAFVTMTHSHDLDFLITAEALSRRDAAYCGMIGSATKRAVFLNWLDENGYGRAIAEGLVCPIGGGAVRDKRPEVIAALTAAEILTALYVDGRRPDGASMR